MAVNSAAIQDQGAALDSPFGGGQIVVAELRNRNGLPGLGTLVSRVFSAVDRRQLPCPVSGAENGRADYGTG